MVEKNFMIFFTFVFNNVGWEFAIVDHEKNICLRFFNIFGTFNAYTNGTKCQDEIEKKLIVKNWLFSREGTTL